MKRLKKEFKLDVSDSVVIKYGTVNKDNPQVIYVLGKCWIYPTKKNNYDKVISDVEANMRNDIKSIMANGTSFSNRFILDFDISIDDFQIGKKKFMSFDFYLRQNEDNQKTLKGIKSIILRKVGLITKNMVETFRESGFVVEKEK